jgi:hypothetical protein
VQINRGKAVVTMAKKDIHPEFVESAKVRRRRIPDARRKSPIRRLARSLWRAAHSAVNGSAEQASMLLTTLVRAHFKLGHVRAERGCSGGRPHRVGVEGLLGRVACHSLRRD